MREILFRGKSKFGSWHYGFYTEGYYLDGTPVSWIEEVDRKKKQTDSPTVIPETVGQFTGLTDKNGKKVFEGDILRFLAYGKVYTGKVEFLNGAFWVKCRFHDRIGSIVHEYKPEIIGNIHDNPELLRGEEDG